MENRVDPSPLEAADPAADPAAGPAADPAARAAGSGSRSDAASHKPIWVALFANLAIAAAKSAGAWYTGSGALLAEALHSLADTGNQGLLLLGLRQAKQPPSPDYPLGHGRAIYFWSFVVALMLFSMGGLVSIYEGVHKLETGEPLNAPWVAVAILAFGVLAEGFSLRTAMVEINRARRGRTLGRWFHDTRRSELLVVFGEDVAALVGLSLALIAVLATVATGNPFYDACGSIAIGVLLVIVAFGVGREVKGLLIGESASQRTRARIEAFVGERAEVEQIVDLITLQQGDGIVVAVRAALTERADAGRLIEDVQRLRAAIRAAFPDVERVIVEPVSVTLAIGK